MIPLFKKEHDKRSKDALEDLIESEGVCNAIFNSESVILSMSITRKSFIIDGLYYEGAGGLPESKNFIMDRIYLDQVNEGKFVITDTEGNKSELCLEADRKIFVYGSRSKFKREDIEKHENAYFAGALDGNYFDNGESFIYAHELSTKINDDAIDLSKYWFTIATMRSM